MSSLSRKVARNKEKREKKENKSAEKAMAQKLNMFDRIPTNCLTCDGEFDKLNKEQVMSWNVVVRQEENKVHLYCPDCWDNAKKLVEEYYENKISDTK